MSDCVPNLRHLYALTEIGRRGSVSRASEQVFRSQSAVTQAVGRLETELGEPLFERTGQGMSPTAAGRLLIGRADRAFGWLKQAERELGQRRGPSGRALHQLISAAQLRALVATVETGGFSLAARQLGVAQPTVHRAVRQLEKLCGRSLFVRTSHGADPNADARRLARYAGLAFAEIRQAFDEIAELRGTMASRLAVGCLPLARTYLLPRAVTELLATYPDARISLVDGPYAELLDQLRHGGIDIIIGAIRDPQPTSDVVQERLFDDLLSIVIRAGHPLLDRPAPTARILAGLDWIAPRKGTPARERFAAYFAAEGLEEPSRVIECSSLATTRGLLLMSDRLALLSVRQARHELASGELAVLGAPLAGTSRPIGITRRDDWRPTAVQARFVEILRAACADY